MQSTPLVPSLAAERPGGPTDPSHDEQLRRGILRTEIGRVVAWLLSGLFLLAIFGVPLSQAYLEHRAGDDSPLLDLFRHKPSVENLRQFEKDIEQASYAKAFTQPRLQLLLTRFGRVGNKLALVGRHGFLYYRPGVLHVGGPGFLDRDVRLSREKEALDAGESAITADPRPAILAFQAALAGRGIRLVVMPVPDKSALAGEPLHARKAPAAWPENRDFSAFLEELRGRGVFVFDAREGLSARANERLFLEQDTHWTPAFMEGVAGALAQFVERHGSLPVPTEVLPLHSVAQPIARLGDIVDMLKLPETQTLFLPQSVRVHQVYDGEDKLWESDPNADVLLLGDSFTNIYSLEGMGWGEAAGLGPQLSRALARPVDVIAQNDSGAFATRQALARELAAGTDRLQGKRVVIWEFASRELSVGDWKAIDWTSTPAQPAEK
jgi:alginate O-acetyltransferase complex protein AlgJ